MNTDVLQSMVRGMRAGLAWPLRILGGERLSPTAISLMIEAADGARARWVLDVDPAHATCHLAPPGRDPEEGGASRLLAALFGARCEAIESTSHPRLFRVPLEVLSGARRFLHCDWSGREGNLILLDEANRVVDGLRRLRVESGADCPPPRSDARPSADEADGLELALRLAAISAERWPIELARCVRDVSTPDAVDAMAEAIRESSEAEEVIPRTLTTLAARTGRGASGPELSLYLFPRRGEFAWSRRRSIALERLGLPAAALTLEPWPALAAFLAPADDAMAQAARAHRALLQRAAEEERRAAILRVLAADMKRLLRLRGNLLAERGAESEGPKLRRYGEAILTQFATITRGQAELIAPDWSAGEGAPPLRIALDPAKSPQENAELYFRRARRWERGEPHRKKRLELIDQSVAKLARIESRVRDQDGAPSESAVENWRREALGSMWRAAFATAAGVGGATGADGGRDDARATGTQRTPKAGANSKSKPAGPERRDDKRPSFRPRSFLTRDGWTVWVGRSNRENDHVTHVLAHPEDLWFHAHGVPGSHVVLRREGRKDNPSAKTLEEAASIAAFFSKARHAGKAPVIYTLKKYVRKPRKAPAGLAQVEREKMIMVAPRNPDEGKPPEWEDE
ncbi:MAG: NFACT RNA binding domain-containing protein [Candidatus Eisenbacteria bacterium]